MGDAATAGNGRPAVKRDRVVQHLRGLIVSGKRAPGDQMPTHAELERRFDAESPTIRAAMSVLREDGFVETRHRDGSFVAAHPPHLSQFAFVFPFSSSLAPSQFFQAIRAEADLWQVPARRVLMFYEIGAHTDVEDYQRLLRYVQSDRLAGLIFAFNPFVLSQMGSPLTMTTGLPRVLIESRADEGGFPTVYPDLKAFLPKAFDHLAARGCKRVAIARIPGEDPTVDLVRIPALAAARGLTVEADWIQAAHPSAGPWLRQLGRLLVRGAPGERPDALVITDDNLVPELTAGLAGSGVRDLVVVAQTNFPHPTPSAVPVTRLGYDIRKLVAVCMERIDQQRRGETAPAYTTLPPQFEEERDVETKRTVGISQTGEAR